MKLYRGVRVLQSTIRPETIHSDDKTKFAHLDPPPTSVIWVSSDKMRALAHGLLKGGSYRIRSGTHERTVITVKDKPIDEYRLDKDPVYLLEFESDGFQQISNTPEWFRTEPTSEFSYTHHTPEDLIRELEEEYDVEFRYTPKGQETDTPQTVSSEGTVPRKG